jgi:lipoyl(octanoyl) transferase
MITALGVFGVKGERREGRVGIWVASNGTEAKIAAIGVRVRKWVTYHGVAINLDPDLSHYKGIVPCGISTYGVTSLKKLGVDVSMAELDAALRQSWEKVFS